MKKNLYHFCISPVTDKQGDDVSAKQSIEFDFASHDDLDEIITRAQNNVQDLSPEAIYSFAVGVKLLGEVMLENRQHPLFQDFSKAFGQLMKQLKSSSK